LSVAPALGTPVSFTVALNQIVRPAGIEVPLNFALSDEVPEVAAVAKSDRGVDTSGAVDGVSWQAASRSRTGARPPRVMDLI
jgi:hypothetical protein